VTAAAAGTAVAGAPATVAVVAKVLASMQATATQTNVQMPFFASEQAMKTQATPPPLSLQLEPRLLVLTLLALLLCPGLRLDFLLSTGVRLLVSVGHRAASVKRHQMTTVGLLLEGSVRTVDAFSVARM
jgi:hypothetical protein